MPQEAWRHAPRQVALPATLALVLIGADGSVLQQESDPAVVTMTSGTQRSMQCTANIQTAICKPSGLAVTATEADGSTQSVSIALKGSIGDRTLMLLYNGATASRFSHAVLTIQYRGGRLGKQLIPIDARPEIRDGPGLTAQMHHPVVSSLFRNDHSYGTGTPFGPFNAGLNVAHLENQIERGGYSPADDTNVL